jgi:hypothetical protein
LLAGYNSVYNGLNFNGYAKGEVLVVVPRGWLVEVRCVNHSSTMRHSCAIVRGVSGNPAFAGSVPAGARDGLAPGGSATFSFVAAKTGTYRIACLVPGHEQGGMWDVLDVTHGRRPHVVSLRQ